MAANLYHIGDYLKAWPSWVFKSAETADQAKSWTVLSQETQIEITKLSHAHILMPPQNEKIVHVCWPNDVNF